MMREIVNGKLGAVLEGAEILFDSTQVWKNLLEIGGPDSVSIVPAFNGKGQPSQQHEYTVSAVSARFKDMAVVDGRRK
jgi:hypothetical protein